MSSLRARIARETADKLRQARERVSQLGALVGLDGFVDEIIAVVDKRHDFDRYQAMPTIEHLGRRILGAVGHSSNFELVVKRVKQGGNGPIMAGALAAAGTRLTYIGCCGLPNVHPVFADLQAAAVRMISIAEPGHTDALEFGDGKIMLGKHASLKEVNWENLVRHVSRQELVELVNASALVAMANWTMLPHMTDIWLHLADEIFPHTVGRRQMFIDLSDPEKRTAEDMAGALALLNRFGAWLDVTLGLNLKEAIEIASVVGAGAADETPADLERLAAAIRERVGLACVVIHPRSGAAAATAEETAWFAGPFVAQPKISTGAGDHFNAGFALGQLLSLSLVESLCVGVATSGFYVRAAHSPSLDQLADFIAALPPPEA
ncbi:MAG TPA: PfkB family carbohydrate kinase [Pirellulales bacterium]|nr:PfkB family carbohydrate kinase [Pirellulales bacterium]